MVIRTLRLLLPRLGQQLQKIMAAVPRTGLAFTAAWQVAVFLGDTGRLGVCPADGCEPREFGVGLLLFVAIFFLARRYLKAYVTPVAVLAAASCAGWVFAHKVPGSVAVFVFFLFITPTLFRTFFEISIRPWKDFFKPFTGTDFNTRLFVVTLLVYVTFIGLVVGNMVLWTALLAAAIWKSPLRCRARWVKSTPSTALPTGPDLLPAYAAPDTPAAATIGARQGRVVAAFCIAGASIYLTFLGTIFVTPLAGYLALSSFQGQTRGIKTAAALALLASAAVFWFQCLALSEYRN